ncbi:Serine/threonine-kinase-like protein [Nymphaea thermarum]|nr:Serine/threonine-kinase-like protein [Nymphaea thermarum]
MGHLSLSCRADSAVATCDSANFTINRRKKKKKKQKQKQKQKQQEQQGTPTTTTTPEIRRFEYKELEKATEGFSPRTLLGRGSHGCVYRGVLEGGRLVAIKRPSPRARDHHHNSRLPSISLLDNEIEILSAIRSPRLVNLLGFASDDPSSPDERLLVVEYMSNGTLADVLHSRPDPPGWPRRLSLALQTAKAVDSLHSSSPPVIHRDIKSSNVLIDGRWNARLGDFGLALRGRVEDDARLRATPPAGTMGYLDPSYLTPESLSTKSDVFSFGILLLEIISGRHAIDVNHAPPSIIDWAIPLIRKGKFAALYDPRIGPPRDPAIRRQLAVIAARCVRSSRERRPSMAEVVEALKEVSRSMPLHMWEGLAQRLRNLQPIGSDMLVNLNPCSMVEIGCKKVDVGVEDPASAAGRTRSRVSGQQSLVELQKVGELKTTLANVVSVKPKQEPKSCRRTTVGRIMSGQGGGDDGNGGNMVKMMGRRGVLAKSQPLSRVYSEDDVFKLVKEQSVEQLKRSRSLKITPLQWRNVQQTADPL